MNKLYLIKAGGARGKLSRHSAQGGGEVIFNPATNGAGNCRLYTTTYAGDGKTSRTFTFPKTPKLVMLYGGVYFCLACAGNTVSGCHAVNGAGKEGTAAWSGSSVTLTFPGAHYLCNSQGLTYQLLAWITEDSDMNEML